MAKPSVPGSAVPAPTATLAQGWPSPTLSSAAAPDAPARPAAGGLPPPAPSVPAVPAPPLVRGPLAAELEALPRLPEAAPPVREVRARPASLWRRAGALLLDAAIVFGVVALYLEAAMLLFPPARVRGGQLPGLDGLVARLHAVQVLPLVLLLGALLAVVYSSVFAFLWGGRSPGRWLFGIRLVDRRGQAPAPGRAVARALLGLVSFGLFMAGFWLSLFDRRGQTLHDKLTRTFVVRPG